MTPDRDLQSVLDLAREVGQTCVTMHRNLRSICEMPACVLAEALLEARTCGEESCPGHNFQAERDQWAERGESDKAMLLLTVQGLKERAEAAEAKLAEAEKEVARLKARIEEIREVVNAE